MKCALCVLLITALACRVESEGEYHLNKKYYVPVPYDVGDIQAPLTSLPLAGSYPYETFEHVGNDQNLHSNANLLSSSITQKSDPGSFQGYGEDESKDTKPSSQGNNFGYGENGILTDSQENQQQGRSGQGNSQFGYGENNKIHKGKENFQLKNGSSSQVKNQFGYGENKNYFQQENGSSSQENNQLGYGENNKHFNQENGFSSQGKNQFGYDENNKRFQQENGFSSQGQKVSGAIQSLLNLENSKPGSDDNSTSNQRKVTEGSTSPTIYTDEGVSFKPNNTFPGESVLEGEMLGNINTNDVTHNGSIKKIDRHEILLDKSQEMFVMNSNMLSDTLVQQNIIKTEGNVVTKTFDGDCKGLGLLFEGGHVKVSSKSITPLPSKDLTFLAWIRPQNTNKITTIYSTAVGGGGRQLLELRPAENSMPNARLKWTIKNDKTSVLFSIETENIIPAGLWTHVIAKYDGNQGRAYLFVNGDKTIKLKDVKKGAKLAWGNDIVLGGLTDDAGKVTFVFNGGMLDVRFVEKPFNDAEISAEYKQCTPENAGVPYLVTVCSGEKLGSGTPSGVYLEITGETGQVGEVKLGSGFSNGCAKAVTVYGPPVGRILKISVRKDNKGVISKSWILDLITISTTTMPQLSELYHFKCNCKFKKDALQRYLDAIPQVNGGWSSWSEWSGCGTGMCGGDMKVRTRACTNPEPSEGGKLCMLADKTFVGFDNQTEPCTVDGNWGAWSSWSECDKICGGAKVTRTRTCDNPAPKNNGKDCVGPKEETKMDCTQECEDWPVNGNWSEWGGWSACSQSCGGSIVTRTRTCTNPAPLRNGLPCEGNATETAKDCTQHCPIDGAWTEWGPWTDCSTTCGPGQQTRLRNCTNPQAAYGGKDCPEKDGKEVKECKLVACPNAVNGNWGSWGEWSECSEKEFCDLGEKKRTRKCDSPAPAEGGDLCIGLDTEDEICPKDNCKPANGDSIEVKPTSFLADSCKAKTAYFAGGTKASEIPDSIYSQHLKGMANEIKTSYFSKTEEKKKSETITKYCFQPSVALLIEKLEKSVFPGYTQVPSLPEFKKPAKTEKTAGLSISLKADGSLFAGEFSLGESASYSPIKSVKLKKVRFFFKTEPGDRGIVAYGQHDFVSNLFDVEVKKGPLLTGVSKGQTDLENIINTLSLPQATSLIGSPAVTVQDTLKNLFIDYLVNLGLSKVQVNGLTEAASATTKRVSGAVVSNSDTKELFYVEIVQQKDFAIGLSSDKATFQNFMNLILKKLKKKPGSFELFGSMTDTTVGIAFAQKGFKVDSATKFEKEPLKSAAGTSMKEGVFLALRTKLPQTCQNKACELAQAILGKDSWLMFTGNANAKGLEFTAAVLDRKITEKIKFTKLELYVKAKFLPPTATVGFRMAIKFPVEGEVYKDNILLPKSELTLGGSLEISTPLVFGTTLEMKGVWRKVFGISFLALADIRLSFEISGAGIPTKLGFSGTVQLGKDCYYPQDFEKNGMCIRGRVDFSLGTELSTQYVYGDISAVTVGKVFRMLGSKLELPDRIANSGFEKEVVISFAGKEQSIQFQGAEKKLKSGLYVKGALNLLGFSVAVEIQVSTEIIFFQVGLSPFELPGKIMLVRSLTDKKNGPLFYAKATRKPSVEIFLQGATKIFGVETEIKFLFKPSLIEATLKLSLASGKFGAELYVKGSYGASLKETGFLARVSITTGIAKVQKDASGDVEKAVNLARGKMQTARDKIQEQKENCKRRVTGYCEKCQENVCNSISANCEAALDRFKNYIGDAANKFGGWFVGAAKKVASTFKAPRERRSAEFFPGRAQMMTRLRRKRFIGNYLCKTLAPAICAGSRKFCEASCSLSKHVTKGVCKGLDLAHKSLFLVEDSFQWAKRIHDVVVKDMLIVHGISFELELSGTLGARVAALIDITIMKVRRKIGLDVSLANLVEMAKEIVNKALSEFKKMLTKRYTEAKYDKPNTVGDVIVGAPFRIENMGNNMCIKSPGPDKAGATLSTGACSSADTQWVYTLTGALMNIHSGLCMTFSGAGKDLKIVQQDCKTENKNQKFTCVHNRVFLADSTTDCLTEKASVVTASTCKAAPKDETEDFEVPKTEEWVVHNDERLKVCDNFVKDLALNKPATQSSTFSKKDLDEEELKLIDPNDRDIILTKTGPELAVNGDMSSTLREGSCSHTSQTKDPWWKVDLQAEHIITDVSIQTVSEGPKVDALEHFEIRVGMLQEFQKNPMCGARVKGTHMGELWTSTCDPAIPGQYVSVQAFGETHLTLCEVAVYARKDNQGKCSTELKKRRSNIANISHRDRVLKRAQITYGRYS